jgi:hypothetical protein
MAFLHGFKNIDELIGNVLYTLYVVFFYISGIEIALLQLGEDSMKKKQNVLTRRIKGK